MCLLDAPHRVEVTAIEIIEALDILHGELLLLQARERGDIREVRFV